MSTNKDTTPLDSDAIMEYRAQVRVWIATDSPVIFGNYSTAHAACVVEEFAKSAEKSIVLMSGAFSHEFYKGVVFDALANAIKRGVSIRIITSAPPETVDIANLNRLVACSGERENPAYFVAHYTGQSPASHFMVVDGKRYRLERGKHLPKSEQPVVQAEVCCNGVPRAKQLEQFFDAVWSHLSDLAKAREMMSASKSK